MNEHPSDVTHRAAALDARDAVMRSLHRTARSLPRVVRVAAEADRRGEDLLDDLAIALCAYASALWNLGVTRDDATTELARTVSVSFAYRHRRCLIALARACASVVYGAPGEDDVDELRLGVRGCDWPPVA
jgi:hypothetical protein